MVRRIDAIVQSLFGDLFGVWHGGTISTAALGNCRVSVGGVCRKFIDGRGRDYAGFGDASGLAFHTPIDGRDMGAYLWIGRAGGGEEGGVGVMGRACAFRLAHL